jgi:hypothetical protein
MAEEILQTIAGVEVTANKAQPSAEGLERFYGHLQTLSGTPEDKESPPVCFTAGLPASCSLWVEVSEPAKRASFEEDEKYMRATDASHTKRFARGKLATGVELS